MERLATPESLAVALQQPHLIEDPAAAEALDHAVEAASGIVRGYCGWSITDKATTNVRRGDGATVLLLPTVHLTEVDDVADLDGARSVVDFDWYPSGILVRPAGWGTGRWAISYRHGWPVEEIPGDIAAVTRDIARRLYMNPAQIVGATMPGGHSRTYTQTSGGQAAGAPLLPPEERVLDRYRAE